MTTAYYEEASTMFFGDDLMQWWIPVDPLGPLNKAQFGNVALPDDLQRVEITISR